MFVVFSHLTHEAIGSFHEKDDAVSYAKRYTGYIVYYWDMVDDDWYTDSMPL